MKLVRPQTPRNEHYFTTTYVGPYVVLQCCCQWSVRKVKQFSAEAVQAAREHVRAHRPERPHNKFLDCAGPTDEERHAGYRNVQLKFITATDKHAVHGGHLRQRSYRGVKHKGFHIGGVKVR